MKQPIHILLIEDNPSYREVIGFTLADEPDLQLVASFGAAEAALTHLKNQNHCPDLILLDIHLPGMSGVESIPLIKERCPDTRIIMLTQSNNAADVVQAIQFGAEGYLLKSSSVEDIIRGIRSVNAGEAFLDSGVAKFIVQAMHSPHKTELQIQLSARENEILILMGEGLLKKQIADQLGIGFHTVGGHVKHIYQKLNVPNAPAAISKAYRTGILGTKGDE
jgi:two-component system nitrate/nitrite response regulator NarL